MISYTKGRKNHSPGFRSNTVKSARLTALIKLREEKIDAVPLYRMEKTGGSTFIGFVGFSFIGFVGFSASKGKGWYTVGDKREVHPL